MSSLNKSKYNKMLTALWIMLVVGIAGASQFNYIIDLPKEFVEKISRTGAQHEDDGFWHPRLTVRTVQLPSGPSGSNATDENPRFVSFLALKQTTDESQVDTLRYMTNDGSDADTKLQGNSKKMICQCRFVRDFMGEETVNLDSVDDISEPASDADVISNIFAQKSSQKNSIISPEDVSGGIFAEHSSQAQKDRFPVQPEDTATTEEILMQTILEKMKEKEARNTEIDSKSQLIKQLKSLLGTNEEEKAAKKELTETEKLTQLIQSLSKKEEEQKAPEPDSSTDFVKFLNMYEQYQKYSNIKSSPHVEKADESDTITSLLKSLSKTNDYSEKSNSSSDEMDSLAEIVKLQKQIKQREEEQAKEAKFAKIKEALAGLLDN